MNTKSFSSIGDIIQTSPILLGKQTQIAQEKTISETLLQQKPSPSQQWIGYSTRILVQASIPHRAPRGSNLQQGAWVRENGDFTLSIVPGRFKGKVMGFPFGNIPRLILIYLCSEALYTQSREIQLQNTLSCFMRKMGLSVTGGKTGTIKRLKNQLHRLLSANISFTYGNMETGIFAGCHQPVAKKWSLWWDEKRPEQTTFFPSWILLDEDFFNEAIGHAVPLDMGTISSLKQSSLALDMYTWLAHRAPKLRRPQRLTWKALEFQMGSQYSRTRDFSLKAKKALHAVSLHYRDLKIEETKDGLLIKPSKPHIPYRDKSQMKRIEGRF